MEALIKGILAQPTLQGNIKSAAIANLLKGTAGLDNPDAALLLDLGLELKATSRSLIESQTGDRILLAISTAHRDLFWAQFPNGWFESQIADTVTNWDYLKNIPLMRAVLRLKEATAITDVEKHDVKRNMATLQAFAEKRCVSAVPPPEYSIQCLFVAMYVALPVTRPLATSVYIEFLVDHLADMPTPPTPTTRIGLAPSKNAVSLLQQCWESGSDNVFITMPHLFLRLSDDERDCSVGIGHLLQAVPVTYTSVVDPFIQGLDSSALWRLKFTVQRLLNWLITIDMRGIGIWIVAIMESLASRGEFSLLRDVAEQNTYKVARQLAFTVRRDDALLVLKFLLLGYHHSPVLFQNVTKGLLPLLVSCRKSPEDASFATNICNLAQTLVIHFGDADGVGTQVQKARALLDLPVIPRAEALRAIQEHSWKKSLQIQNASAGFRRKPAFNQPFGKVGLVNLGNSCFMNSALQALFCSEDFKKAILNDTLKVEPSRIMTTKLRETFTGLSTSRLSVMTPSALYKALPEWLNDGHQQDAAEFTKILFSRLEDEDPATKRTLASFQGKAENRIECSTCGTVSSNIEEFYDLLIPLPRTHAADLQSVVEIFPSIEDLNDENNNTYFCDRCDSLQAAKRLTMLDALPTNLIISLNRFEFDVKRSRRIKIDTPIVLTESIRIKIRDGHEFQGYNLYAVVIHTGESANHGHYYTYARDSAASAVSTSAADNMGTWLLYNDTSISVSSFEVMRDSMAKSRTHTPYMLFFRKADRSTVNTAVPPIRAKRSISNL